MNKVNRTLIQDYFNCWKGKKGNDVDFVNMLMKKSNYAARTGKKVMAYGEMRDSETIQAMFELADDMAMMSILI